jgi:hypothetical protein
LLLITQLLQAVAVVAVEQCSAAEHIDVQAVVAQVVFLQVQLLKTQIKLS